MNTLLSYNGRMGFEARFLWESGIMKRGTYDQNVARQRIEVLHRSAPGIPAVVAYDTLPLHLKSKVDRALANRGEAAVKEGAPQISVFESLIHEDADARSFYADYQLTDGRPLPAHVQTEYYNNAIVLNAVREMLTIRKGRRDAFQEELVTAFDNKCLAEAFCHRMKECSGACILLQYNNYDPVVNIRI